MPPKADAARETGCGRGMKPLRIMYVTKACLYDEGAHEQEKRICGNGLNVPFIRTNTKERGMPHK
jgi:hypothetical protein